jgi:hypothetical protein
VSQSNDIFLDLLHATEEIVKGTKLCRGCMFRVRRWNVRSIDGELHWFCPQCGRENDPIRVHFGPEGTLTVIEERRHVGQVALQAGNP